jgi:hypothetical protein
MLSRRALRACAAGVGPAQPPPPAPSDAALPVYTVVIALYREASVVRQLARAIDRFDYPRAKLDVKFVIEADDAETGAALRAHPPRTKPRALNIAVAAARGELVAVFDAEDIPDGWQLRRAAALFAAAPANVGCLQASLVIDNGATNWMTGLFALDYAALFDVFNPGLARLELPIFLGGTSNHFRIGALREIGFWDAWNVTEDAELGLRLARAGYLVRTFDSPTFEEAPAAPGALLRQRTRWFKGWMQTGFAHCRSPARFFGDLGARRGFAVLAMFANAVLGPLLAPFLAVRLLGDAAFGALLAPATRIDAAFLILWAGVALAGAFALLVPLAIGARRLATAAPRGVPFLLPLWLAMLSVAAWRALFDLWRRPSHWEKTEHGLTARGAAASGEEPLLEGEAGAQRLAEMFVQDDMRHARAGQVAFLEASEEGNQHLLEGADRIFPAMPVADTLGDIGEQQHQRLEQRRIGEVPLDLVQSQPVTAGAQIGVEHRVDLLRRRALEGALDRAQRGVEGDARDHALASLRRAQQAG